MVKGGDVPNRSAAEAGNAATVTAAQARDNRTFIGDPRIGASTATLQDILAVKT
jgi:hypothetical protein